MPSISTTATPAGSRLTPTPDLARIEGMDIARGFALLGIFLINITLMADAVGRAVYVVPLADGTALDTAAFYINKLFVENRFYPLFSMLFGMGMALLFLKAAERGRLFWPLYLRRLLLLAGFGLLHIALLWYGDVLLTYALVGLVLMGFARFSGKALLYAGLLLAGVALLFGTLLGLFGYPAPPPEELPTLEGSPIVALWNGLIAGEIVEGANDGLWIAAETQAFRDGPFAQALFMRLFGYLTFTLFYAIPFFYWSVAAMFLIGAGLLKRGFFSETMRPRHARLALGSLLIALPLGGVGVLLPHVSQDAWSCALAMAILQIAGPLTAFAYLCLAAWAAHTPACRRLVSPIAAAGRMALTVYLLQSLLAAAVFQHWGARQFGQWSHAALFFGAIGLYLALVGFSALWMSLFRFGPVEWLWRSATYCRLQPLLRHRPTLDLPQP